MGGGSDYDRDVGHSSSSSGFFSGGTSSGNAKIALNNSYMDSSISPFKRTVHSDTQSPITIMLDVTGSNIEFARIVYDKLPMFYGQIKQQGYLSDFDICISAIGDAYCDSAPLQVCDFKSGKSIDDEIKKLWLESGGGGQLKETYELGAYFFSKYCEMPNAKKPYMFIIGDEAAYPELNTDIVTEFLGRSINSSISTKDIFSELLKVYDGNVFMLENPYGSSLSKTNLINSSWKDYFGQNRENVIMMKDEKSVIDIILGIIATNSGTRNLDSYIKDMTLRGQTKDRINDVRDSISSYANSLVKYDENLNLISSKGIEKYSGTKRL